MDSQSLIKKTIDDVTQKMDKTLDALKHSLSGLRTGRASASLLDSIKVEAYGDFTPMNQVATVSVMDARMLSVQVWDYALAKAVEKAIMDSGLGLNPIAEGSVIRVPLPLLSEERRKELSKKANEYGENSKVAIRNIRRDGIEVIKKAEKDKVLSEDEQHKSTKNIQDITDLRVKNIDTCVESKVREIMTM